MLVCVTGNFLGLIFLIHKVLLCAIFFLLQGNWGGIIASVLQKYRLQFGGKKQFQTSSFICCVEVSRLRKCDRVQVNVYVNPRDFHCTYNQLFAFLLPTQGFVIRKSWKIKLTSDLTDAEVGIRPPNFRGSQLWRRGDECPWAFASTGWLQPRVCLMKMDITASDTSLSSSVPSHQSPYSRGRERQLLFEPKALWEPTMAAVTTSLISSEFYLVKMLNLIFFLYENRHNCRFSFHAFVSPDAVPICSLLNPMGALSPSRGAWRRDIFWQVLWWLFLSTAPRILPSEEVLR